MRVVRLVFRVAQWLATAGLVLGLVSVILFLTVPRLLGWELQVVLGRSMEPALPVGAVTFVQPTAADQVRVGDMVAYWLPAEPDKQVTHRVEEVVREGGSLSFRTKGDANEDPDSTLVPAENVVGRVRWHIPWLGYLADYLRTPVGFLTLLGIPGLFIITSEVFHISSTLRWRRQGQDRPQHVNRKPRPPRRLIAWLALGGIAALAVSPALVRRRPTGQGHCHKRNASRVRKGATLWPPLWLAILTVGLVGSGVGFWASGSYALFSDRETSSGNTFQAAASFAIPATIDIDPDTLNPDSEGNFVMAYVELPEGYDVADIDVSTVTLEIEGAYGSVAAAPSPTAVGDEDGDGIPDRMVKFDRAEVLGLIDGEGGDVTFVVAGKLVDGQAFKGTDTVRLTGEGGSSALAPPGAAPSAPLGPSTEYQVQPGDTLWHIATRFGTTVEVLGELNGLEDPSLISYGSTLNVPYVGDDAQSAADEEPTSRPSIPTIEYEVQPGDSLSGIAARFGTTVEALAELNGVEDPSLISYGSTLSVPYVGEEPGDATADVSR